MLRSRAPIRAFTSVGHLLIHSPLLALTLALCAAPAVQAQQKQVPVVIGTQPVASKQYPSPAYEAGKLALAEGDYKVAFESFRRELAGSYKMLDGRWVDSVCPYTMLGEAEYRMGHYSAALEAYKAALELYVKYGNWMQAVQFADTLTPEANNRGTPWGKSTRGARPAKSPTTTPILIGQNAQQNMQSLQRGGPLMAQQMVGIQPQEIVRCTCLAMERRRELLGPLAGYDSLTDQVLQVAIRRQGRVNHWSESWLDAQQGFAYAAAGRIAQATATLQRSLTMLQGQFDHPLTGPALLELGKLSLEAGDLKTAGGFFEEATYSSFDFADLSTMEEAFRGLFLAHHLAGDAEILDKPLSLAAEWARKQFRELDASLLLTAAENFALRGKTQQAVSVLGEATTAIARHQMGACEIGARLSYLTAMTHYQRGVSGVTQGDVALNSALAWEREGSKWLFQIGLADNLCVTNPNGKFSLRAANELYSLLLRDPTPSDWAMRPLESLGVMNAPHPLPFEHWLEIIVQQSNSLDVAAEPAIEVADQARRHRFLSSLPLGGRLLSLRWVLEAPEEMLDNTARLQRTELLTRYPKYAESATKAKQLRAEIAQVGLNGEARDAQRTVGQKLTDLTTLATAQEAILHEMAVRREAAEIVFPPSRKVKDVQQSLAQDSLMLAYFNTSHAGYGWFLSADRSKMWKIDNLQTLEKRTAALLKAIGNYDANHELTDVQLADEAWKSAATDILPSLVPNPKIVFERQFKELVLVPDGLTWYVPFEALPLGDGGDKLPLIARMRVRYAPTVALAMPQRLGRKSSPQIGIALDKLFPNETAEFSKASLDDISRVAPHAVTLKNPLPGASPLLGTALDGLIVIDDVPASQGPFEWTPVPLDKGRPGASTLAAWMMLPWKSTDQFILPGFHTPAESSLKSGGGAAGNDLFLATTGLMATGARTILLSRWRTGGQTTIDLVREFVQELPFTPADEAWQRAVQLVRQAPLDPPREPRVKRNANAAPMNADHPFFWSGYVLVDSGVVPHGDEQAARPPLKLEAKNAK
jgi:tetratricopeptide (TPR) repeat protein